MDISIMPRQDRESVVSRPEARINEKKGFAGANVVCMVCTKCPSATDSANGAYNSQKDRGHQEI